MRKMYSANGTTQTSNRNGSNPESLSNTFTENENGEKQLSEPSANQTPYIEIKKADARHIPLPDKSVDLIITSPPYWRKRDYGISDQIGQEKTPREYVDAIIEALREWRWVLRPTGSVFLNIGDTYWKRSLTGIPGRIEAQARDDDWIIRNRIIWAKDGGMPEPAQNRLANRHEYILHLAVTHDYYYDMFGYSELFGTGANPGDVWHIGLRRNTVLQDLA